MRRLWPWACEMQGAKKMLNILYTRWKVDFHPDISKKNGKDVYNKALYDWLMDDLAHIEAFMAEEPIYYTDHRRDDKGKLVSVRVELRDN